MRRPGNRLGAEQAHGTVDGVARDRLEVELRQRSPGREAVAGLGTGAVVGQCDRVRRTRCAPRVGLDAERVDDRRFSERIAVAGALDAANAGVARFGRGFEIERDLHLLVGRHRGQFLAPQVEVGRYDTVGIRRRGQRVPLVGFAEGCVVARLVQGLFDDIRVERTG